VIFEANVSAWIQAWNTVRNLILKMILFIWKTALKKCPGVKVNDHKIQDSFDYMKYCHVLTAVLCMADSEIDLKKFKMKA
jgi:hypothetical protein